MTKVEQYVDTLKKIAELIPAYPGTPRGNEFVALNAQLAVLDESLTEDDRAQLDELLGKFYEVDEHVRTIPLVD